MTTCPTCPKCFARHCRCQLSAGEAAQIAAADSVKVKVRKPGKGKKVAGVFGKVVPHNSRGGFSVSKSNY